MILMIRALVGVTSCQDATRTARVGVFGFVRGSAYAGMKLTLQSTLVRNRLHDVFGLYLYINMLGIEGHSC